MTEDREKDTRSMRHFRAFIRAWMAGRGLSRAEAAAELNLNYGTFVNFLNGNRSLAVSRMEEAAARLSRELPEILIEGRALLAAGGRPEGPEDAPLRLLSDEDLVSGEFLKVPFSDHLKLAAGGGGTIPVTDEASASRVVVHGPSLGRRSARHLQAFRVGGDSMEPLIAEGGIVLADTSQNDLRRLREGGVYVLCWDLDEGECAVKHLRWAEKGRWLSIESEASFYKPVIKRPEEVILIGRVIWSWREHH